MKGRIYVLKVSLYLLFFTFLITCFWLKYTEFIVSNHCIHSIVVIVELITIICYLFFATTNILIIFSCKITFSMPLISGNVNGLDHRCYNLLTILSVVIECTGFDMKASKRKVYRAKFSSVTEKDISKAMDNLVEPNRDEALSVDARQEIDLKVGVAFSRFQTSYFQGKYQSLDCRVISSVSSCLLLFLSFCFVRKDSLKSRVGFFISPHSIFNSFFLGVYDRVDHIRRGCGILLLLSPVM